ncbi:hypothetical protein Tco_0212138 [Tanacetum coccineum]
MGLRVADSHNGIHREDGFTPLETIRRFLACLGVDPIRAQRGGLRAGEEEMDFRSFMMEGVDGEFNFLPEEGCSLSTKTVNNKAYVIHVEPITATHPLRLVEDICNSDDAPFDQDDVAVFDHSNPQNPEVGTSSKAAGRRKQVYESPLDVDSDPDIHVAHVTPPSWKKYLKEINLEKLCDIHDKAYMRQAALDNTLNRRTRKLMSTLSKAGASCDAIREREVEKDKAYAELERKCNEALQDLDKNPLVLDMRFKIKTLQGQVDGLHSEYSRLVLEEKKWVNYEQKIDGLKHDRATVVSKVVPYVATKLIHSDEMGLLVAKLVKAAIFCGGCIDFEEVASLKEPFILEKMSGYYSSSKEEFDQAGDGLANSSYPFLTEVTANPYMHL